MAGLDVYRYPGVTLDHVLSPAALFYMFYALWFNHIYHSTILIMSKSAALAYYYDIPRGRRDERDHVNTEMKERVATEPYRLPFIALKHSHIPFLEANSYRRKLLSLANLYPH